MFYYIYAKDKPGDETIKLRLKVRENHLASMKIHKEKGSLIDGRAVLDENGVMVGSMLLVEFNSIDEVESFVKGDVYYTNGVWQDCEIIRVAG